ncbi:hypothetical protein CUN65_10395 [Enterobacter hormaechei subsp. xiangfangensis]|nr:hypothetical protein CUN65_10395 [Enterobacter hormaechei subsp. xiangfangensis]
MWLMKTLLTSGCTNQRGAGHWGYKIGDRFSPKTYATVNEAKLALFDDFWSVTQENEGMWSSD